MANPLGRPAVLEEPTMVTTTINKKDKDRIKARTRNQSEFIREAILEKLEQPPAPQQ